MSTQNPFVGNSPKHIEYQAATARPESVKLNLVAGPCQLHPLTLQDLRDLVRKTEGWPGELYMEVTTTSGRLAGLRVQNMPPAKPAPRRVRTVTGIKELPVGTVLQYTPYEGDYVKVYITHVAPFSDTTVLRNPSGEIAAANPGEIRLLLDNCAPEGMLVVWDPETAAAEKAAK